MADITKRWQFKVLTFLMIVVFGFTTTLRLIIFIVTHPIAFFRQKSRSAIPDVLVDPALGNHEYMAANGLKFHYVVKGDRTKPLMLMLHGFPEFWFSWRHQIREFGGGDYRVIAVDMRGYGDTTRPPNQRDYNFDKLRMDIVQLISQFGYAKCTLVCHDWGGVVGWRVVQRHPEIIDNFIVMNCPHPKVYAHYLATDWKQIFKSWYIFMFQLPVIPELVMAMYDYDSLVTMFTKPPGGAVTKGSFPPEVLEAYKYTFSQPGALTAPINYYRCMLNARSGRTPKARGIMATIAQPPPSQPEPEKITVEPEKITVPTLLIWGDNDAVLNYSMADMHTSLATNITIKHIPNCSHWVQQDKPEVVNQHMREFLKAQEEDN